MTLDQLRFSDGYLGAVRWWRPASPRGVVLYLHGIQSHGGWYEASAAHLAEAGFAVVMPDRRGSGLNREQRGHYENVERCLADGDELLHEALWRTGESAAHLVGVSWGGRVCVALAGRASERVASMTLVAPGLFPRVDLSGAEKFRVAISLINHRSRMFDIPLNDPKLFTSNLQRQAFVEADALKLTQVSASFLLASRRLDRQIRGFGESAYRGPIHLFLAGRDQIIQNEPTRAWLRKLPSTRRQITEYPEAEHTLEFEPDAPRYFEEMTRWILATCAPSSVG